MSQSADDNSVRAGLEQVSGLLRRGEFADAERRLSEIVDRTESRELGQALEAVRDRNIQAERMASKLEMLARGFDRDSANQGPASTGEADEDSQSDSPFDVFEEFEEDESDAFDFEESMSDEFSDLSEMDEDSATSFEGGEQAPTRVAGSIEEVAGGPGGMVAEDEEDDEADDEVDEVGGTRMGAPQPRGEDESGLSDLMEGLGSGDEESSEDEQLFEQTDGGLAEESSGAEAEGSGTTQQGAGFDPSSDDHSTAPRQEPPESSDWSEAGGSGGRSTLKGEPGLSSGSSAPSVGESNATQHGAPGYGDGQAGRSGGGSAGPADDDGDAETAERETVDAGGEPDADDEEFDLDLGLDNPGSDDSAGVDLEVEAESSPGAPLAEAESQATEETPQGSDDTPTSEVSAVGRTVEQESSARTAEQQAAPSTEEADEQDDDAFELDIDWDDELGTEAPEADEQSEPVEEAQPAEASGNQTDGPRYDVGSSRPASIEPEETTDAPDESRSAATNDSDGATTEGTEQSFGGERQSQRQTAPGSGLSVPEELAEESSEPVDEDRFMELADSISDAQKPQEQSEQSADQRQTAEQSSRETAETDRAQTDKMSVDASDSNEATQAPFMQEEGGSDLYAESFREQSQPTSGGSSGSAAQEGGREGDPGNDSSSGAVRLLNEARRLFEDGHLESAHDLAQSILEQSGGHQGAENLLYEIRQAQRTAESSKETAEGGDSPTPRSVEAVDPSNPPPEAIPPEDIEPAEPTEVSTVEGEDPRAQSAGPSSGGVEEASVDDGANDADDGGDESGLEDLSNVPTQAVGMNELAQRDLDHRYGFVFSMIDGQMSFEDLVEVCSMPREETLEVLAGLKARSLIEVD